MTTHFKLKLPNGLTRRISFSDQPTWSQLAEKIHLVHSAIPFDKIAVSYIDAEDDEVTLSSQDELQDFYSASYKPGDVIKFSVQDLSAPRSENKPSPPTPPAAHIRNTFGGSLSEGLPFNIDEDWQHFPSTFGGLFTANPDREDSSLHAFVEVVDTDASSLSGVHNDETTSESESHASTIIPPRADKGKAKAKDDDVSSTVSLLAEQAPEKPDIHVYDVKSKSNSNLSIPGVTSHRSSIAPIGAESTPRPHVQDVTGSAPPSVRSRATSTAPSAKSVASSSIPVLPTDTEQDPPLPPLDSASLDRANPSLSGDIATLLSTLTSIVASHPELSEGFRNIIHNASAGTYWASQREALTQAAGDIEEEAGRRVADALGVFFRSIAQVLGTSPPGPVPPPPEPNADIPWRHGPWSRFGGARGDFPHRGGHFNAGTFFRPPFGPPPFHHGPFPPPPHHGPFTPPPPHGPHSGFFHHSPPPGRHGRTFSPPPPPPPPGFSGSPLPPRPQGLGRPPPPPPANGMPSRPPPPFGYRSDHEMFGDPPSFTPFATFERSRNRQTSTDLRNQVEAAKLLYKAEKERYRQDREERRRERAHKMMEIMGDLSLEREDAVNHDDAPVVHPPPRDSPRPAPVPTSNPAPSGPAPQIVSNARGSFPQFEMVGVPPRRSHTLPAHAGSSRRRISDIPEPTARAIARINRKLADMGFTESAHPDLPSKIRDHLPENGTITKEKEDDIVTSLLEELVTRTKSPVGPVASGSKGVPGAWH